MGAVGVEKVGGAECTRAVSGATGVGIVGTSCGPGTA